MIPTLYCLVKLSILDAVLTASEMVVASNLSLSPVIPMINGPVCIPTPILIEDLFSDFLMIRCIHKVPIFPLPHKAAAWPLPFLSTRGYFFRKAGRFQWLQKTEGQVLLII